MSDLKKKTTLLMWFKSYKKVTARVEPRVDSTQKLAQTDRHD